MLELRDQVLSEYSDDLESDRAEFDRLYYPVLENLETLRTATKKVGTLISEHRKKVESGKIVSLQSNAVTIHETIEPDVKDAFGTFLNAGARALKKTQPLLGWFQIPIGHLFQNQPNYEKSSLALRDAGHPTVAIYLDQVRDSWCDSFMKLRNDFEHDGWTLDKFEYPVVGRDVTLEEPTVDKVSVSEYCELMTVRIIGFVEDLVVHALSTTLPDGIVVSEIPAEQRDPARPTRFSVTLASQQGDAWALGSEQGFR